MSPAKERLQMDLPCKRHMHDRLGNSRRDRGVCKFRWRPDLVKPVKLLCPFRRIPAQLPRRIDHVVGVARQILSEIKQCEIHFIAVSIEYIDVPAESRN